MINEAMFAGSSGYVLKLDGYRGLRSNDVSVEPQIPDKTLHHFAIHVLAAQNLPLPDADGTPDADELHPYLVVKLFSQPHPFINLPPNEKPLVARTKTSQGIHPNFEQEILGFQEMASVTPELAFVTFQIMDERRSWDKMAAWACVSLDRLKRGYRCIRLRDSRGKASEGMLLVKIEMDMS